MSTRPVREVMDTESHAIRDDAPVIEAVRLLIREGVTGAPVVDESGAVVGMITEVECLQLLTGSKGGELPAGTVRDHMSPPLVVSPEMDIHYVAGLFRNQSGRRFAVVGGGRLLGVVTRKDILRALDRSFDDPRYQSTPAPASRR